MRRFPFFILLLLCMINLQAQIPAEYAPTPPMGWNSWDCFGFEVTEDQVKATADYMAEHLLEFGWEYVVIDMGWYYTDDVTTRNGGISNPPQYIDAYGRLIPDTLKHPSAVNGAGLKPLADYIHSKGLKFGIHIMRGIPWKAAAEDTPILDSDSTAMDVADYGNVCEWSKAMVGLDMNRKASQQYYNSIFQLYAAWGVDYIKVDDVAREFHDRDMMAMNTAIQRSGRQMVLSVSPGASPIEHADFFLEYTNLFRISNDFWDHWKFIPRQMDYCEQWYSKITSGHWPDIDMLPLGKLRVTGGDDWVASLLEDSYENIGDEYSRFTDLEKETVMSLWCIFKSPLMFGGNLPETDPFTYNLITNAEALEVSQQSENNILFRKSGSKYIWTADHPDTGDKYVAFFNLGETDDSLGLDFEELGISQNCRVRNIWQKADQGIYAKDVPLIRYVRKHGSVFLKLSPTDDAATITDGVDHALIDTITWDYWYSCDVADTVRADSLYLDGAWFSDMEFPVSDQLNDSLGGFWTEHGEVSYLRLQDVGNPAFFGYNSANTDWLLYNEIEESHDPLDDILIYVRLRLASAGNGFRTDSIFKPLMGSGEWPGEGYCDTINLISVSSNDEVSASALNVLDLVRTRENQLAIYANWGTDEPRLVTELEDTGWHDILIAVKDTHSITYYIDNMEAIEVYGKELQSNELFQKAYLSMGAGSGDDASAVDIDFIAYRTPLRAEPDHEPPTPVRNLIAKQYDPAKTDVRLVWSRARDNVEVVKYVISGGPEVLSTTTTNILIEDLSAGQEYTFSVVAFDASGNRSEAVSITYTPLITSAGELEVFSKVAIYPVPAGQDLHLSRLEGLTYIELFDLSGKEVLRLPVQAPSMRIDVEELAKGPYLIRLHAGSSGSESRLVMIE